MEILFCILLALACMYMAIAVAEEIEQLCFIRKSKKQIIKENMLLKKELDKCKAQNEKLSDWFSKHYEDDVK